MIELGKVAIVRLVMRAGSAPRFCALVPQVPGICSRVRCVATAHKHASRTLQKEVVDEYGEIESPAGMFMIPLPFADDIRTVHAPSAGPPGSCVAVCGCVCLVVRGCVYGCVYGCA